MRFEWILFDADDTLLDFTSSARHAFSAMLNDFSIDEQDVHYPLYRQCNHEAWAAYEAGEIDSMTLRARRFARFMERAGIEDGPEPLEMNGVFLRELIGHTIPVEGALELLEALHGKIKMALVTNGLKEVQRPRVNHIRFDRFFEAIIVSDEIGLAKPDPAFFAYTHQAIGCPLKSQMLVVGDNLRSDIEGGQRFDLPTCWYNPQKQNNPSGIKPDYEIHGLEELRLILSEARMQ